MRVHDAASRGFERGADAYERGRPGYPPEAVRCLAGALQVEPGRTVVDLAAGTGKLTRELVRTEARVIAVEPVAAMRTKLAEALPAVAALDGTAEELPLDSRSADAVTVAQAFHWFRPDAALAEIHRVLRPGRGLGLVWNMRDESTGWVARLSEILAPHEGAAPRQRLGRWRPALAGSALFGPLEERRFAFAQEVDRETLLAAVESRSYVAALADGPRASVLAQVAELVETHPETRGRERFPLPYRTEVYWCAARKAPDDIV